MMNTFLPRSSARHLAALTATTAYTAKGLSNACATWGDRLSVVRRDLRVRPVGDPAYVRKTC
ncbi:hypothetical protein [Embleya sp. AB8]|uniref:hypothetical protein n=1 Tax=Embleya sp. AB8 TaxID=3156304 RepID=UPI003C7425AE